MTDKERVEKMDHMFALIKEIDIIKERFQPEDTGHFLIKVLFWVALL